MFSSQWFFRYFFLLVPKKNRRKCGHATSCACHVIIICFCWIDDLLSFYSGLCVSFQSKNVCKYRKYWISLKKSIFVFRDLFLVWQISLFIRNNDCSYLHRLFDIVFVVLQFHVCNILFWSHFFAFFYKKLIYVVPRNIQRFIPPWAFFASVQI